MCVGGDVGDHRLPTDTPAQGGRQSVVCHLAVRRERTPDLIHVVLMEAATVDVITVEIDQTHNRTAAV